MEYTALSECVYQNGNLILYMGVMEVKKGVVMIKKGKCFQRNFRT
jgi:hypothetical protein